MGCVASSGMGVVLNAFVCPASVPSLNWSLREAESEAEGKLAGVVVAAISMAAEEADGR